MVGGMNRLDCMITITLLDIVAGTVISEKEQKAKQNYEVYDTRQRQYQPPSFVLFQSLLVIIFGQDKGAEHGYKRGRLLRGSKNGDTRATELQWYVFIDHANHHARLGAIRKSIDQPAQIEEIEVLNQGYAYSNYTQD